MAAARAAWPADAEAGVGGIAPERLVFLDECGVLTGMARLYGRSPRGTRAPGEVPHGPWTRLSVLGALGREGMLAAMSVQAAKTFHPLGDEALAELLARTEDAAKAGAFELFKTSAHFDTTARHAEWLGDESPEVKRLAPQGSG